LLGVAAQAREVQIPVGDAAWLVRVSVRVVGVENATKTVLQALGREDL
jgi:hypothetical protein